MRAGRHDDARSGYRCQQQREARCPSMMPYLSLAGILRCAKMHATTRRAYARQPTCLPMPRRADAVVMPRLIASQYPARLAFAYGRKHFLSRRR